MKRILKNHIANDNAHLTFETLKSKGHNLTEIEVLHDKWRAHRQNLVETKQQCSDSDFKTSCEEMNYVRSECLRMIDESF